LPNGCVRAASRLSSHIFFHNSCFTYHRECASLRMVGAVTSTNPVKVAAAPANLPLICQPTSLSTGYGLSQCENDCYPASCCWMENIPAEESCVNNVNCTGYAACLNLRASATNSTNIVKEVMRQCTISQIITAAGKAECESVCKQHNCCWELGNASCFREADW
jgi:hypothetical protein